MKSLSLFSFICLLLSPLFFTQAASANMTESTKIVLGDQFACALRVDGQVSCWGNSKKIIDATPALQNVSDISAFWRHVCAVSSGKVVCWGENSKGQLDVPTDLDKVVSVSVGLKSSCAATLSHVKCWGDLTANDPFGTLIGVQKVTVESSSGGYKQVCVMDGNEAKCWSATNQAEVTPPQSLGKISDLKSGYRFACGKTLKGWVCWGDSTYTDAMVNDTYKDEFEISDFDYKHVSDRKLCKLYDGSPSCFGFSNNPSGYVGVKDLSVGSTPGHVDACANTAEGVRCWGPTYDDPKIAIPMPSILQNLVKQMNPQYLDGFLGCYIGGDGKQVQLQKVTSQYEFDSNGKPIQLIELSGAQVLARSAFDDVIKSPSMGEIYISSKTPKFNKDGKQSTMIHAIRVFRKSDGTYAIHSAYGWIWGLTKSQCH